MPVLLPGHDGSQRRPCENEMVILFLKARVFHVLCDQPEKAKVNASQQKDFSLNQVFQVRGKISRTHTLNSHRSFLLCQSLAARLKLTAVRRARRLISSGEW